MTALLPPGIDPQCGSSPAARVCPLDPDPAITHLFDTAWPRIPELWGGMTSIIAIKRRTA
ncbi:hypothetical protein CLV63_101330 [Murinocardiopsis flavida]|uniref:Uncharacterized protein n=1 Tax=Murinocardiopsis flavida TaxID=645275 RepID=A0A2P8DUF9_9ACTN|nr:hypothetical protein [Murinocardiopsis flavida]PSL00851.1 hypothetical protein CLV63_101330 [Murinocardiopsis flavida]